MPNFIFKEETHEYFLDGVLIPSVTGILNDLGIINTSFVTADDLSFGSKVHKTTELYDLGTLPPINPMLTPYLNAWKKFLHESKFIFDLYRIEKPKYSPKYKYGFTIDRPGWFDGLGTVLDIKTSMVPNHLANRLQLALYQSGENEYINDKHKIKRRIAVHLNSGGGYKIWEYKDKNDINIALSCLNIYNLKKVG